MKPRPFHHQRPLAAVAAAYGAGVWAGVSFSWMPLIYLIGFLCAGGLFFLLPALGRRRVAGVMAGALLLGMGLSGGASHPALPQEGRYAVTGVLTADACLREDGKAAAYLTNVQIKNEAGEERTLPGLYWTYWPEEEAPFLPLEGERVSFSGTVYHPKGQVNPYGFDFRLFLLQKGVPAGVSGAEQAAVTDHPGRGLRSVFYHARQGLIRKVRAVFGEDSALPEALLLGWREDLPRETQQSFANAGAAHLLAVSGLHVGLLAGAALLLFRRFMPLGGRLAVMGVLLLLYCALLDFSAPVVRASLLLMAALYRPTVRRAPDGLTALCAAFLMILLFRPLDLFSASFQLSFCAVLGIVVLYPRLKEFMERRGLDRLGRGAAASFSATAGAVLPTVQVFHRFSLAGLILNPLLIPVFGALVPLYALTLLAGCVFPGAGLWLASWLGPVTRALLRAVEWVGAWPFASVRVPALPWYCVAAAAIVFALFTRYWVGRPGRKRAAALGLLILSFGLWRLTLCRDVQYIQLAAGQADAALILDGDRTVMIDAGDYGGDAASYLLAAGRQADTVILTHLHTDHCMGLRQLLDEGVPIGEVCLPAGAETMQVDEACLSLMEELRARGVPVRYLAAGDEIATRRVKITVLWPMANAQRPGGDANRYALAALCDMDGVKLLAMSDVPGDYEMYAVRDADILKAAHHGSKNSTGADFLKAASPFAALVTDGGASAVLPHPDTLNRLKAAGVQAYRTGRQGAITLTVRSGEAHLAAFLREEEPE